MTANRGMTAAMLAALDAQQLRVVHLAKISFSTPILITDAPAPITFGGDTYLSDTRLIDLSGSSEQVGFSVGDMSITLSGANSADIALALTTNYIGRSVVVYRALLAADYTLVADPVVLWAGVIDSWTLDENMDTETSEIVWKCASHWADFERIAGRLSNDDAQQVLFPGDRGLEYAGTKNPEIKWGAI